MYRTGFIISLFICSACVLGVAFVDMDEITSDASATEKLFLDECIVTQVGLSSYYAPKFHTRTTANGERFDLFDFTAAHRRLPFGTIVKVTKESNNRSVIVRINDRGPFIKKRIIDLSHIAASYINCGGVSDVVIEYFAMDKTTELRDSNYLLGYSINRPLVVVNKDKVLLVDSSNNWDRIINRLTLDKTLSDDSYLFIKNRKLLRTGTMYYIGALYDDI